MFNNKAEYYKWFTQLMLSKNLLQFWRLMPAFEDLFLMFDFEEFLQWNSLAQIPMLYAGAYIYRISSWDMAEFLSNSHPFLQGFIET